MAAMSEEDSVAPSLLCSNNHEIVKLKEGLRRFQGRVHGRACNLCGNRIERLEPHWRCEHHCAYNVCQTCCQQHYAGLIGRAGTDDQATGSTTRQELLLAVPPALRGVREYAKVANEFQLDVPRALGIRLHGAKNVPGPRGLDVTGFSCPYVVAEVLSSRTGACLAAAQSHVLSRTRDAVWDQVLSLPSSDRRRGVDMADRCATCMPSRVRKLLASGAQPPDQWAVNEVDVHMTLYDRNFVFPDQVLGECCIPLTDLLEHQESTWLLSDPTANALLGSTAPYPPCELTLSIIEETLPKAWPRPKPREEYAAAVYPRHVFMMTRGTRGDVQPFIALARGMAEERGWMVTICTELRWKPMIKANSKVSQGRIRFRPSGGDTEARMESRSAKLLMRTKTEILQMAALALSEAEFFSSATVFIHHVQQMEKETRPVDLILFGLTVAGVAAIVSEHCGKPMIGFILQPSIIPSREAGWAAVHAIHGPNGRSLLDRIEEAAFTSHGSLRVMKASAEHNPFSRWNIDSIRRLFGLGPADTWAVFRLLGIPLVVPMKDGTFSRPADWWEDIKLTDFIFLRTLGTPCERVLEEPLQKFIENARASGGKIGLMSFSSMPVPRRLVLKCAVKMVTECKFDLRLIWVGRIKEKKGHLEAASKALIEAGRLIQVPKADFGMLFRHIDCFIIHGGLGTTVEALRTKKPCCVTGPLLFDQRFWGSVCAKKGVGPEPMHIDDFEAKCVDFVNGALDEADPYGWRANARACDWGEETEDGVKANVDCIAELAEDLLPVRTRQK